MYALILACLPTQLTTMAWLEGTGDVMICNPILKKSITATLECKELLKCQEKNTCTLNYMTWRQTDFMAKTFKTDVQ